MVYIKCINFIIHGKRTWKLLGAHQERFHHCSEREHGCFCFRPNHEPIYVSSQIIRITVYIKCIDFIICVVSLLLSLALLRSVRQEESSTNKNVTFCSQNKENLRWRTRFHVHALFHSYRH
jgi:hypothetical protein